MKKTLLLAALSAAFFALFSFQPSGLSPDVLAAKTWYEANITTLYVPDWNNAEYTSNSNGEVIYLPLTNYSTFKWGSATTTDSSKTNGVRKIMITKPVGGQYSAIVTEFFVDASNTVLLNSPSFLNLKYSPSYLESTHFNGQVYLFNLQDLRQNGGFYVENGVPIKKTYRISPSVANSTSDRECVYYQYYLNVYTYTMDATCGCLEVAVTGILYNLLVCDNSYGYNNSEPWGGYNWISPAGGGGGGGGGTPPSVECQCTQTYLSEVVETFAVTYSCAQLGIVLTLSGLDCKAGKFENGVLSVLKSETPACSDPFNESWELTNTGVQNLSHWSYGGPINCPNQAILVRSTGDLTITVSLPSIFGGSPIKTYTENINKDVKFFLH
jgi:hypothetical protein